MPTMSMILCCSSKHGYYFKQQNTMETGSVIKCLAGFCFGQLRPRVGIITCMKQSRVPSCTLMKEVEAEGIRQHACYHCLSLRDELGERELSLKRRKGFIDSSPRWPSASLDTKLTRVPVSEKKLCQVGQHA